MSRKVSISPFSLLPLTVALVSVLGTTGCTWVELTPAAESTHLGAVDELEGCKKVGSTKTRTKTHIGFIKRSEEKVNEELRTLARNDAPELGGDTVVPDGPVDKDGMQRFTVYDCPDDSDSTK